MRKEKGWKEAMEEEEKRRSFQEGSGPHEVFDFGEHGGKSAFVSGWVLKRRFGPQYFS